MSIHIELESVGLLTISSSGWFSHFWRII